jgi:hypothetical protein
VSAEFATDAVLAALGVEHGFGTRGAREPAALVRPRQVHGCAVARVSAHGAAEPHEADAIVSDAPRFAVAVLTADCVPILLALGDGAQVAAVHAGWRGLAAGVVAAGVAALRAAAPGAPLRAAIGPHIGPCCYEVDAPVTSRLAERFGDALAAALRPARPDHHQLDLGALVRHELLRAGLARDAIGTQALACTMCNPRRFHSHRRDGAAAGRLVHFIRPLAARLPA